MRQASRFPRRARGAFGAALVSLVAAQAGFALEAPARTVEIRCRFRPGESWRERILHEVEVRDEAGGLVSSRRAERTDSVEVVSVDPSGCAAVRRSPWQGPKEVFGYAISDTGAISLAGAGEGNGAPLLASLVGRFAPVLPTAAISVGESVDRQIVTGLPGNGAFVATETATLTNVGRGERAELALRRRLRGQDEGESRPAFVEALRVPDRDAWLTVARPARVRLEVTGLAGEGKLVFDTLAEKLVSYEMLETTAIEATLVAEPVGEPVGQTLHWTVTVRFEVERVD